MLFWKFCPLFYLSMPYPHCLLLQSRIVCLLFILSYQLSYFLKFNFMHIRKWGSSVKCEYLYKHSLINGFVDQHWSYIYCHFECVCVCVRVGTPLCMYVWSIVYLYAVYCSSSSKVKFNFSVFFSLSKMFLTVSFFFLLLINWLYFQVNTLSWESLNLSLCNI